MNARAIQNPGSPVPLIPSSQSDRLLGAPVSTGPLPANQPAHQLTLHAQRAQHAHPPVDPFEWAIPPLPHPQGGHPQLRQLLLPEQPVDTLQERGAQLPQLPSGVQRPFSELQRILQDQQSHAPGSSEQQWTRQEEEQRQQRLLQQQRLLHQQQQQLEGQRQSQLQIVKQQQLLEQQRRIQHQIQLQHIQQQRQEHNPQLQFEREQRLREQQRRQQEALLEQQRQQQRQQQQQPLQQQPLQRQLLLNQQSSQCSGVEDALTEDLHQQTQRQRFEKQQRLEQKQLFDHQRRQLHEQQLRQQQLRQQQQLLQGQVRRQQALRPLQPKEQPTEQPTEQPAKQISRVDESRSQEKLRPQAQLLAQQQQQLQRQHLQKQQLQQQQQQRLAEFRRQQQRAEQERLLEEQLQQRRKLEQLQHLREQTLRQQQIQLQRVHLQRQLGQGSLQSIPGQHDWHLVGRVGLERQQCPQVHLEHGQRQTYLRQQKQSPSLPEQDQSQLAQSATAQLGQGQRLNNVPQTQAHIGKEKSQIGPSQQQKLQGPAQQAEAQLEQSPGDIPQTQEPQTQAHVRERQSGNAASQQQQPQGERLQDPEQLLDPKLLDQNRRLRESRQQQLHLQRIQRQIEQSLSQRQSGQHGGHSLRQGDLQGEQPVQPQPQPQPNHGRSQSDPRQKSQPLSLSKQGSGQQVLQQVQPGKEASTAAHSAEGQQQLGNEVAETTPGTGVESVVNAVAKDNQTLLETQKKLSPRQSGTGWKQAESAKMLAVGDRVLCVLNEVGGPRESAEVISADAGGDRVYVHFTNRDRRLDRWVPIRDVSIADGSIKMPQKLKETPKLLTRSRRRQLEEFNPVSEKEVGNELVEKMEKDREERTKVKNVAKIVFGKYEMDAWYFSPYPGPYGKNVDSLYICGNCLKYMRTRRRYNQHCSHCDWNRPPGTRIYHQGRSGVSVYEVDGLVNTAYCQRLCLLGKLFLDHKTLFFDVAPFLFYIITIGDEVAGFFSKEKAVRRSEFNLACILTLPQHQRKGVGRFLITLSYELTRREGKTGSPERPLSDLGQLSYRSYWNHAILNFANCRREVGGISVEEAAKATGIRVEDVVETLKSLQLLKPWKGERLVLTSTVALDAVQNRKTEARLALIPELLDWVPENPLSNNSPTEKSGTPKQSQPTVIPMIGKRKRSKSSAISTPVDHRFSTPVTPRPWQLTTPVPERPPSPPPPAVYDFVRCHTAERVLARVNTLGGLTVRELKELAETVGMSMEKAMRKLREAARELLADPRYEASRKHSDAQPLKKPRLVIRVPTGSTPPHRPVPVPGSASGAGSFGGSIDLREDDVLRTPPRGERLPQEVASPGWPSLAEIKARSTDRERAGSSSKRPVGRPRGSVKKSKSRESAQKRDSFSQEFFSVNGDGSDEGYTSGRRGNSNGDRGERRVSPRHSERPRNRFDSISPVLERLKRDRQTLVASGRKPGSQNASPIRRRAETTPPSQRMKHIPVINLLDSDDDDDDLVEIPNGSKSRYSNGGGSSKKY